jgi:hypothetical protein
MLLSQLIQFSRRMIIYDIVVPYRSEEGSRMDQKPNMKRVSEALSLAFGVGVLPSSTRLDDMNYTKVQILDSTRFPLITVIGVDGKWTLTVEFAQDDSGDIEAYAAGNVTTSAVVEKVAEANVCLGGFLLEGFNLFVDTLDYDPEDRELNRRLAQKVAAASKRLMTDRPNA